MDKDSPGETATVRAVGVDVVRVKCTEALVVAFLH
jgi:hypothetical protein